MEGVSRIPVKSYSIYSNTMYTFFGNSPASAKIKRIGEGGRSKRYCCVSVALLK